MQLSVIIVNYNVRYFVEQCLCSVLRATEQIEAEIIIVDNNSTDDSMIYLRPLFPSVQFIANPANTGFAKANNQALAICKGKYVLFLNPDTLVPEDCLQQCVSFLEMHPQTGALGVKMLDGRGDFLPESKRAFPSPIASFYKLTGLAALFPRSNTFNRYALGGLDKDQDHEVAVLAGAFMMGRADLLRQLNGFDEDYFLYGEDIDLSYRITRAGWKNRYFAQTSIIHFKGESAGRMPVDRVGHFYNAMRIFVRKHYGGNKAGMLLFFLSFAIWFRAGISFIGKLVKPMLLPLIDLLLLWLSLQTARMSWIRFFRGGTDFHVPFIPYALPLFACLFILSAAFTGWYEKTYRSSRTLPSMIVGVVMVLAVYALLPESLRFSRGVIISGSVAGALLITWFRFSLFRHCYRLLGYEWERNGQIIIVGNEKEYSEASPILEAVLPENRLLGRIATGTISGDSVCNLDELPALLNNTVIDEIVFCIGELKLSRIIEQLQALKNVPHILYHIQGTGSMVGSDLRSRTGRTIGWQYGYRITEPYQRRMKRLMDLLLSLLCLLLAPLHFVFFKQPVWLLKNAWQVFVGNKTWVGYLLPGADLPLLKPSVIPQSAELINASEAIRKRSDRVYALHYDWWQEAGYIFSRYGKHR